MLPRGQQYVSDEEELALDINNRRLEEGKEPLLLAHLQSQKAAKKEKREDRHPGWEAVFVIAVTVVGIFLMIELAWFIGQEREEAKIEERIYQREMNRRERAYADHDTLWADSLTYPVMRAVKMDTTLLWEGR